MGTKNLARCGFGKDSAKGLYSIPYSYYWKYVDTLLPLFVMEAGTLPGSHRISCNTLLPLQGKHGDDNN